MGTGSWEGSRRHCPSLGQCTSWLAVLPPWSKVGQGDGPALHASLRARRPGGREKGPHSPLGRSPCQPWRRACLSQEGQVTKTDKSICQESLSSLSQEAQKGNCSWGRRRRRRHLQELPACRPLLPAPPSHVSPTEHLQQDWPQGQSPPPLLAPGQSPSPELPVWGAGGSILVLSGTPPPKLSPCLCSGGLKTREPPRPQRVRGLWGVSAHPRQTPGQCDH